ncbi:hypothetical protein VNO77_09087 [Canavalia gladiata]|uniref:Uncharacterized protein n=1 Tax=Canavalia gladiata TaxID=3824 RepID=A0AAN9M9N4_CANGL
MLSFLHLEAYESRGKLVFGLDPIVKRTDIHAYGGKSPISKEMNIGKDHLMTAWCVTLFEVIKWSDIVTEWELNTVPETIESKLGVIGRLDIQAFVAAGYGPKCSHIKHGVAYGQPLVKCPSNIGKSFPSSLLIVNDIHSGYGAWPSSNITISLVGPNNGVERVGVQNGNMLMDILQLHKWQLQQSQNRYSDSVTGGVYKAQERIHRRMAHRRLLAIPASWLRSLRDLTQHLTARADDNHAPPVSAFPKAPLSLKRIRGMSSPGKYPSFTARTTGVSNPIHSPSFRLSVSVSAQQSAFAVGVLSDVYAFHRSTGHSLCPYRTSS